MFVIGVRVCEVVGEQVFFASGACTTRSEQRKASLRVR